MGMFDNWRKAGTKFFTTLTFFAGGVGVTDTAAADYVNSNQENDKTEDIADVGAHADYEASIAKVDFLQETQKENTDPDIYSNQSTFNGQVMHASDIVDTLYSRVYDAEIGSKEYEQAEKDYKIASRFVKSVEASMGVDELADDMVGYAEHLGIASVQNA